MQKKIKPTFRSVSHAFYGGIIQHSNYRARNNKLLDPCFLGLPQNIQRTLDGRLSIKKISLLFSKECLCPKTTYVQHLLFATSPSRKWRSNMNDRINAY